MLSSSRIHGAPFLEYCRPALADFLEGAPLLFVPFALADHAGYRDRVAEALGPVGIQVTSLHAATDPVRALQEAAAVFVGGGNTFRLLNQMAAAGLLGPLRERVLGGRTRYIGSSAGTNLACPHIKTTNDMPIVQPASFDALGLIPFQINPHYLDPDPHSTHQGETREQRLSEFHEENWDPVLGIREGSWLEIHGDEGTLHGPHTARLFRRGESPMEWPAGSSIGPLLQRQATLHTPLD